MEHSALSLITLGCLESPFSEQWEIQVSPEGWNVVRDRQWLYRTCGDNGAGALLFPLFFLSLQKHKINIKIATWEVRQVIPISVLHLVVGTGLAWEDDVVLTSSRGPWLRPWCPCRRRMLCSHSSWNKSPPDRGLGRVDGRTEGTGASLLPNHKHCRSKGIQYSKCKREQSKVHFTN